MDNKLTSNSQPVIFQQKEIRRIWFKKQWYFSVVDIIQALTDSVNPRNYWHKMKKREKRETRFQLSTICRQLKLISSDGKKYLTDCANVQNTLRIIQSIPSKKAEPFKLWLAKVGKERIEEIQNPELAMARMKNLYRQKGYPENWIEKRARGIAIRNELTDEWKNRHVYHSLEFAILTNEIMNETFGMKVGQYKKYKKLKKENLRDHMDDMELIFTMLAEATTTRITRKKNSKGFPKLKKDAKQGGQVAGRARKDVEQKIGEKITSPQNFFHHLI
ncbi:Bro-N domain-containing protein [Patescibacteria group bacterium]|nr:Bro-N domain-containing protein [Patescibacteria group bacterium]MCG2701852.1 Bro-N domain-containing protein [Candidatus Parcubacteria bacterium]MBU4265404.1 Bro-N domain-containing protein [Patescibacteria group bacterium]MBU4390356.1 Bro-N domain-containing protein [Patescibacteria group bacterium]MBU4396602.1 Bro-N domain-containing protein [Patescibacteria group bacterium]